VKAPVDDRGDVHGVEKTDETLLRDVSRQLPGSKPEVTDNKRASVGPRTRMSIRERRVSKPAGGPRASITSESGDSIKTGKKTVVLRERDPSLILLNSTPHGSLSDSLTTNISVQQLSDVASTIVDTVIKSSFEQLATDSAHQVSRGKDSLTGDDMRNAAASIVDMVISKSLEQLAYLSQKTSDESNIAQDGLSQKTPGAKNTTPRKGFKTGSKTSRSGDTTVAMLEDGSSQLTSSVDEISMGSHGPQSEGTTFDKLSTLSKLSEDTSVWSSRYTEGGKDLQYSEEFSGYTTETSQWGSDDEALVSPKRSICSLKPCKTASIRKQREPTVGDIMTACNSWLVDALNRHSSLDKDLKDLYKLRHAMRFGTGQLWDVKATKQAAKPTYPLPFRPRFLVSSGSDAALDDRSRQTPPPSAKRHTPTPAPANVARRRSRPGKSPTKQRLTMNATLNLRDPRPNMNPPGSHLKQHRLIAADAAFMQKKNREKEQAGSYATLKLCHRPHCVIWNFTDIPAHTPIESLSFESQDPPWTYDDLTTTASTYNDGVTTAATSSLWIDGPYPSPSSCSTPNFTHGCPH
jgi:hypothetical protein